MMWRLRSGRPRCQARLHDVTSSPLGLALAACVSIAMFPAMVVAQEVADGVDRGGRADASNRSDVPAVDVVGDETSTLPSAGAMGALSSLVGDWEMTGTTHRADLDEPAGSGFTATQTARWEIPGRTLRVDWVVLGSAGDVVGEGRGRIAYDDIASAIVNTYAGHDLDARFTGSATLIDASRGALEWRGHETRGLSASVNFEVSYLFPDASTFVVDFIPTCVDGELGPRPSRFTWRRRNAFLSSLPSVERLVGDWTIENDSGVEPALRTRGRFGPGRRSLVLESLPPVGAESAEPVLLETIWFDPASERVRYRAHRHDGGWMEGDVVGEDDGTLVVDWRGVDRFGEPESGRMTLATSGRRLVRAADDPADGAIGATGIVASYLRMDEP